MAAKQIGSLIKGLLYDHGSKLAQTALDKVYDYVTPDKFQDGFTQFQDGNRQMDNWGTFGTFLAKTAYDVLSAPLNQTNSALPPSQGTVTQYAPAVPQAEGPVKMIHTNRAPVRAPVAVAGMSAGRESIAPRRRVVRKKATPKRINASNKMIPKKKKTRRYRVNI